MVTAIVRVIVEPNWSSRVMVNESTFVSPEARYSTAAAGTV